MKYVSRLQWFKIAHVFGLKSVLIFWRVLVNLPWYQLKWLPKQELLCWERVKQPFSPPEKCRQDQAVSLPSACSPMNLAYGSRESTNCCWKDLARNSRLWGQQESRGKTSELKLTVAFFCSCWLFSQSCSCH